LFCLCIVFCERSKLFRKDGNEYKERGIGEMKILYHPERNTYRLLFRREKVNTKNITLMILMYIIICFG
jgi:E3 SUMO-protein ligase RanBP2